MIFLNTLKSPDLYCRCGNPESERKYVKIKNHLKQ